jgi:hypothetical protein
MSSANRNNLTSFFPVCVSFISFACLIALSGTSNTTLNRSSESGHPNLYWILVEIFSALPPFIMTLAVVLFYFSLINGLIMLRHFLSITRLLRALIKKGCGTLPNVFSVSVEMTMQFLSLITWIYWHILNQTCMPSIDPT